MWVITQTIIISNVKMNINIKITEGCGIVVNRNELSSKEANRKNQLYSSPSPGQTIPQRDRPLPPKPNKQTTKKTPKEVPKERVNDEQVRKFQRQMNQGIKELNKNQASLGMLYNNTQIVKGQQQVINGHQEILKDLMEHKKKTEETEKGRKPQVEDPRKQQQMLRDMTLGLNKELEEIRRLRDDIFRVAKQFSATVADNKGRAPTELPTNLVEMNKNLKAMAETSKHNIDLISPQKLQLLSKLQNFNLQGYTQHLNQLKSQIAMVQKQSEQVEKELRQRLTKLEKVTISPKFEEQLLQPYQENIKNKLATIDLGQAKKKVLEKLGGEFDYIRFQTDLSTIQSEIRGEMSDFYGVIKKFQIDVPELRLDQRQLKALDIKLPSILEEYKASRGIVTQPPKKQQPTVYVPGMRTAELARTGPQKRTGSLSRTDSAKKPLIQTGQIPQPMSRGQARPRSIEQLQTKPKDYTNTVQYKNISEEERFKTVLNAENAQKQRREAARRNQEQASPKQEQQKKGKTRDEEDFEKYLQARANEQLEQIYKQKKEKLIRMKHQLYEQSKDEPAIQIVLDRKNKIDVGPAPKPQQKKITPKPPLQHLDALGEAGRKLIDTRQGMVLKDIGKQALLQTIKDIFSVEKPPVRIEDKQPKPQQQQPTNAGSVNNFAEGFLSVINNTLASMNRGLTAGIEKKLKEREDREGGVDPEKRVQIPLPILEQIPKPPVFNLKFQRNIKGNVGQPIQHPFSSQVQLEAQGGYPTFTNFNMNPRPVPVVSKKYDYLEVSDIASDISRLQLDKSDDIKSDLSGISGISRSGNLGRSKPLNQS